MDDKLKNEVITSIKYSLSKDANIFLSILDRFEMYYDSPCNTIQELKKKSTKTKGDLFEIFCTYYLKALDYDEVWLLQDIPLDVIKLLRLKTRDMGIDIVAKKNDKYYAIQAKYRKVSKNKKYNVLGWKELSTFYALCARSGPWEKHIVMTTCDYIRNPGVKSDKDVTLGKKKFMNTKKEVWFNIISTNDTKNAKATNGYIVDETEKNPLKKEQQEVRIKRADYFEKLLYKK
jgi:hypothetical protein